jgi:hypothetical protein
VKYGDEGRVGGRGRDRKGNRGSDGNEDRGSDEDGSGRRRNE